MNSRTRGPVYCRNCGKRVVVPHYATSDSHWVHVEARSGLLLGPDCYYTPRADPMLA